MGGGGARHAAGPLLSPSVPDPTIRACQRTGARPRTLHWRAHRERPPIGRDAARALGNDHARTATYRPAR